MRSVALSALILLALAHPAFAKEGVDEEPAQAQEDDESGLVLVSSG